MVQLTQPFPDTVPLAPSSGGARDWSAIAILGVWVCGFSGVALIRFRGWLRIRAAVRASIPINIPATVEVRSCPGLLEPGVVGLLRPILLLPAGIAERLTLPQLETVLAHELCHVRRRDNLLASIHMIVEAVFWFYPLVWWIGFGWSRSASEPAMKMFCGSAVSAMSTQRRFSTFAGITWSHRSFAYLE
jgi:beta-lactamase regulating signal transducer with metallopeptidase domain